MNRDVEMAFKNIKNCSVNFLPAEMQAFLNDIATIEAALRFAKAMQPRPISEAPPPMEGLREALRSRFDRNFSEAQFQERFGVASWLVVEQSARAYLAFSKRE